MLLNDSGDSVIAGISASTICIHNAARFGLLPLFEIKLLGNHRRERGGVGWGREWRTGHLWCQTELWWMIDVLAI